MSRSDRLFAARAPARRALSALLALLVATPPTVSAWAEIASAEPPSEAPAAPAAKPARVSTPLPLTPSSLTFGSRPPTWGDPPRDELKFLGLLSSKATLTNVNATGLLTNQVVGRLYSEQNGTTTQSEGRGFMESRALAFFDYQPQSVNGRARLKAGFEVDFTFGDAANGVGGNSGGGVNGDQVNLQTKRLLVELDVARGLTLVVGLQPLADSAFNPTQADPYDLLLGGGRLMFWGTDASGVSLFGRFGDHAGRVSLFHLNINDASEDDDTLLWMADAQLQLTGQLTAGLHAWLLKDRSGAKGGGVDSLAQARYVGATPLNLGVDSAHATLGWLGADVSFNRARRGGRLSVDLAGFMNMGSFEVAPGACRTARVPCASLPFDSTAPDLVAFFGDAQVGYRWGVGDGDALTLGAMYSTGDNNPDDRTLSSVVTGNAFGTPGALFAHHRALLLFPDPRSINRHVGVVYDPGNLGYGLQALMLSASADLLPETLNLKVGAAYAAAAALPLDAPARAIGAEVNAELLYRLAPFLWVGAHAGVVRLGRFLESAARVPAQLPSSNTPWTTALSLTWVQL